MKHTYKPSAELIADMITTRKLFGEAGYLIFDPAPVYVRSQYDFVAIEKKGLQLALVRVGNYRTKVRKLFVERIEVRRHQRHGGTSTVIESIRPRIAHYIRQRQELKNATVDLLYEQFIDPSQHEEYFTLFPKPTVPWYEKTRYVT